MKDGLLDVVQALTEIIAFVLCLILVASAAYLTYQAFHNLLEGASFEAILDSLFIVILLELFYVIRSFIKRGSMNVGVIINVGVIAAVKEMIFKLDSMELQLAISFGVIFLSLGLLYLLEVIHFAKKKDLPLD